MSGDTGSLCASLREKCKSWRQADGNDHDESLIVVKTVQVERLVEIAEVAAELSRFLGHGGDPDLRTRVAKLDVALEALDG